MDIMDSSLKESKPNKNQKHIKSTSADPNPDPRGEEKKKKLASS